MDIGERGGGTVAVLVVDGKRVDHVGLETLGFEVIVLGVDGDRGSSESIGLDSLGNGSGGGVRLSRGGGAPGSM